MSFPDFCNAQVLVIGDVMLDRYWHGVAERISPEYPVPVVNVADQEDKPGGAANVAMNIAALRGKVCLLGLIGEDDAAQSLQSLLNQGSVNTALITEQGCSTITKLRVLSQHHQMIRLDFEKHFSEQSRRALLVTYTDRLKLNKAVILSDYGKGTLPDQPRLISLANEVNCPILVDPKGKDFSSYRGATLLTPNRKEFEAVVGPCETETVLFEKALEALQQYDLKALLITRSHAGMTLFQRDQAPLHLSAYAKEVFDVTGAGDTVIALIAAAMSLGISLEEAIAYANLAASLVISKKGTSTINLAELYCEWKHLNNGVRGIVNEVILKELVNHAKAQGQRIVMTNGCFDILHMGHVHYLKKAKALGDRLIVAVNTDCSIKALKGEDRPVNALAERMAVLAELECVDWIFAFSEATPLYWIETLTPDVLVKGSDYDLSEVVGADHVLANGGEVQLIDFFSGYSTTKLIEKIRVGVK